jgi:lysophospholipase L1-like esterase
MLDILKEFGSQIEPSEIVSIKNEVYKLKKETPLNWQAGTKLRHLQTIRPGEGTPAPGAIIPGSVRIQKDALTLEEGRDYILDHDWGSVGLKESARIGENDDVTIDYSFSLLRIDSVAVKPDGGKRLVKGHSDLTVPCPPELGTDKKRIANIFIPYHSDGSNAEVFPVLETPEQTQTFTTTGRIQKTIDKLKSGKPVKVVCWGDSVTAGGDASTPQSRYTSVFESKLKKAFPDSKVSVKVVAVGGSNSQQWLRPDAPEGYNETRESQCRWQKIVDTKPDLVTAEFVNDSGLNAKQVNSVYEEILKRLKSIGPEVIFILPHFTMMSMMNFNGLRESDSRPYVEALRNFAEEHSIAIADASSRWGHLWKEGIPYITLLKNGINHPDDRGHEIFAEELIKCFGV